LMFRALAAMRSLLSLESPSGQLSPTALKAP
jgi:hypothetical protein